MVAAPGSGAYQHWGRPENGIPEPNQRQVGLCGVANASQTYTLAWGWADTVCNTTNTFICRMQREYLCHRLFQALLGSPFHVQQALVVHPMRVMAAATDRAGTTHPFVMQPL